ncbi:MAG: hypothetical protein ACT4NL_14775 [Pseudomarimonas sp.]
MTHTPFRSDLPHVFMVVPFHARHDAIQQAMREAAASIGLACYRTDDIHLSTSILERVLRGIESATVVVADLTDSRPNCYYELGYADALKRPVVLVSHAAEVPGFDVTGRSICRYDTAADLALSLPRWLIEAALVNRTVASKDDANAGRFGGCALVDGYLLSAQVRVDPPNDEHEVWSRVTATVRRIDGRPLPGNAKVKFFLDKETFKEPVQEGEIINGVARYAFDCYGAFSLGAKVGNTSLELDLRHVPGATDLFRSL